LINKLLNEVSELTASLQEITPDILLLRFTIVNACIVVNSDRNNSWVLVDTGMENSDKFILETAENRFGADNPPKAIILTHGHFDHVGSVVNLANHWNIPVYAHKLEIPYITGKKDYPQGDPSVDEGLYRYRRFFV